MHHHAFVALTTSVLLTAAAFAQSPAAEEGFSYANGDLTSVGVGGLGWDATQGGWQVGDSTAGRRFVVAGNECYYNGDGVSQIPTWQPRALAAPVTTSTSQSVVVSFTLFRNEQQPGRGIGVQLVAGGQRLLLIGKEINGPVGLHETYINGATYASFATSGTVEPITAVFTYDGVDTSIVLSDSDEVLPPHTIPGVYTFDGFELFGYHKLTVSNGIDDLRVAVTTASASNFGAGCGGLTLTPIRSTPWVGNGAFGLNVGGASLGLAFVSFGSGVVLGGFPLDSVGMVGCNGYSSGDLGLYLTGPVGANSVGTLNFPIPSVPALAGQSLGVQGLALSPATALGLSASNGCELTFGL
jgi:hypothetical protein